MTLQELILALKKYPNDFVVHEAFDKPHSYRGYYEQLSFEPVLDRTVGELLIYAEGAVGGWFTGYKGGEFRMTGDTIVNICSYGDTNCDEGESANQFVNALSQQWDRETQTISTPTGYANNGNAYEDVTDTVALPEDSKEYLIGTPTTSNFLVSDIKIPRAAGWWVLGPPPLCTQFPVIVKPSQKHIDNHLDLLGWVWKDNV
jgi:hypothetical protein